MDRRIAVEDVHVGSNRRPLRDVKSLADSMEEIGLLNPITVRKNGNGYTLVAGLHRLEAAKYLDWLEIEAVVVDLNDLEAELAEIDENLIRHDLTDLERGIQINRRKEVFEALHPEAPKGQGGDRKSSELNSLGFTSDSADKTGQSQRTVQHYVQIGRDIVPDVQEALRDTHVADSKNELLTLARQEPEVQREVAGRIAAGEAPSVSQALTDLRREGRVERMSAPCLEGSETVYPVVYADPPWQYDFSRDSADEIEEHYPTMTVEDICALPVPAAADAALFLWATAPKLPEALQVMAAWGFRYKTCAVWDKEMIGMGYWFRGQHELLLVGTRGDVPPPKPEGRPCSVLRERRGRHSEKPAIVRAWIEAMFPDALRIELFAREKPEGWSVWGNEA